MSNALQPKSSAAPAEGWPVHPVGLRVGRAVRRRAGAELPAVLQGLYANADDCVLMLGANGEILWNNPAAGRAFGGELQELRGKSFGDLLAHDSHRYEKEIDLRRLTDGELASLEHEAERNSRHGENRIFRWSHTRLEPQATGGDDAFTCLSTGIEITLHKREMRRLAGLAHRDALTGLYNRRSFEDAFEQMLDRAAGCDQGLALLYLDIDDFKSINDLSGHKVGDEVLRCVARLLEQSVQASDLPVRQGSDEFAVVMDEVDIDTVSAAMQHFSESLGSLRFRRGDRTTSISCSIGVAIYPQHGRSVSELMANAEMAMFRAKSQSRTSTNWVLYDASFSDLEQLSEQMKWKDRLQTALHEDRVRLYYQPIMSLRDGSITHCEALVRMTGEDGQLVMPSLFIRHAESVGLVNELDRRAVDIALMDMSQLLLRGLEPHVAVNVSTRSLQTGDFYRFLRERLASSNVPGDLLTIEITETAAIESVDQMAEVMRSIGSLGCKFSLDDFGAGFSSWLNLSRLPISFMKIDGSFVRQLTESPDEAIFVRAINEVSQSLDIRTVAECVEDQPTLLALQSLGIDYVQGFFVGRPVARLSDALAPGERLKPALEARERATRWSFAEP